MAFDLLVDAVATLGSMRGRRYSAVIRDNVFTHFNVDEGMSCSQAIPTLQQLRSLPPAAEQQPQREETLAEPLQ
eukprot:360723-Chlamydomonas_euryale.AAC.1